MAGSEAKGVGLPPVKVHIPQLSVLRGNDVRQLIELNQMDSVVTRGGPVWPRTQESLEVGVAC